MTVYTIYVNGAERHTDVSEDEFFDIMDEYSYSFYMTGTPHPDDISHVMKEIDG
jgi:hypothetical protein|tara:strand:- start:1210 stop:1371 length:162 start_codon:yes stop_codon:yes gene_type:complete